MSALEETLELQLISLKVEPVIREYRFAAEHVGGIGKGVRARLKEVGLKDWRFDFAWPEKMLAVEVEGGAWVGGRHTRGKGFTEDLEKYHAAMDMGWNIYRCSGELINRWDAANLIKKMLRAL